MDLYYLISSVNAQKEAIDLNALALLSWFFVILVRLLEPIHRIVPIVLWKTCVSC